MRLYVCINCGQSMGKKGKGRWVKVERVLSKGHRFIRDKSAEWCPEGWGGKHHLESKWLPDELFEDMDEEEEEERESHRSRSGRQSPEEAADAALRALGF